MKKYDAFLNSKNKIAIQCKTLSEYYDFLRDMSELGIIWADDSGALEVDIFRDTGEDTCIRMQDNGKMAFADYDFYRSKGYTIIESSSISYGMFFIDLKKEVSNG